uniref:NADH-ubiquinone oxidoreductase chain 2 n=1 Tax=Cassida viridis TaxID=877894 RepID=A0A3G1GRL5_9CUCU|nr:NADH dehydrogenase subunit 2 [Cassida viridis]
MLFFNSLVMSSLIVISSYSWMMMWVGVEINLLSIIPIITKKNNLYSSESSMKYFLAQSLASSILIFSILMMEKNIFVNTTFFIQFALLMKLGMAPFHWWLPEVMEGLNWMNCLIILTWQKIAPMIMLMMMLKNSLIMNLTIVLSSLISGIQGLNQISMKKIMAYSSINHMAWMLMSIMSSSWTWLIYFLIYLVSNILLVMYFSFMKINFINQINSINMNKTQKTMLMLNFFSLSGMPPMIGFLPKWLTISFMIKNLNMTITFILILSSLIHIYFYMRIIMPSLMMKIKEPKKLEFKTFKNFIFMISNLMFLFSLPLMNCLL